MSDSNANGCGDSATYVSTKEITESHDLFPRLQELREFYCAEFGEEPHLYVRVPGRVNIIGEHVDYCGYPVLPLAIDQCILLAVGHTDGDTKLDLRNIERHKYDDYTSDLLEIDMSPELCFSPDWYNYYMCGIKGIYEILDNSTKRYGMKVAVSGNIPPASGVSSSSALVSSAVLATAAIHDVPMERKALASISAKCERYIGTQGGGMDQAIAYLAKEGCAQFIEFYPNLRATSLKLPEGACFVVANSLAEKNKAASSDFNERVVECGLGCRLIALLKKLENWRKLRVFAVLQAALGCDLSQLEKYAKELITKDMYTRAELCSIFGMDDEDFQKEFLTANTRDMQRFKLRQRTLHVIQESLRVQQFRMICEHLPTNGAHSNGDAVCDSDVVTKLSQLKRQSHESLKTLYECSHPNLDLLVTISDEFGVGARLTGAGWGGCIVALCDSAELSRKYITMLKEKYYALLPDDVTKKYRCTDFNNVVFATCPRDGAEILKLCSQVKNLP